MSTLSPEFVELQRKLAGRYSLEEELHRGPLTTRFKGRDVALDRPVVLEFFRPEAGGEKGALHKEAEQRFLEGARRAAGLFHPHVQLVHAVAELDGVPYMVRAPVRGQTLAWRVESEGPLREEAGRRLMEEVAWALSHAHDRGVVHGRLTPEHIVLEAESDRAVVLGLGTAQVLEDPDPVFRPPEMARPSGSGDGSGEATPQADLFALGACLEYALTGRNDGKGELPPSVGDAIEDCLASDPGDRPASAAEVTSMVAASGELPATLPPSARRLLRRIRQFSPTAVIGAFGLWMARDSAVELAVVGVVGAAFAWMGAGLVRGARDVLADGLDLELITRILESEARELRKHPDASPQRLQNLAIGCGSIAFWFTALPVWIFLLIVGIGAITGGGPGLVLGDVGVASLLLVTFLFLAGPIEDKDSARRWLNFGERMMVGRFGRLLFRLARLGRKKKKPPTLPTPGEPTALVLSDAVEGLLEELPPELRRELSDAPEVIRRLRDRVQELRAEEEELAAALRELARAKRSDAAPRDPDPELEKEERRLQEVERELEQVRKRVRKRTFELTRALEQVRLKLLRIAAQAGRERELAGELTLELARAGRLGSEAAELLRARGEVRRMLDVVSSASRAPAEENPDDADGEP